MSAQSTRRHLVYALRRLGLPGGIGVGMIILALAYLMLLAMPDAERLVQLGNQVAADQERLSTCETQGLSLSPAQKLAAFYGDFPKGDRVPDQLGRVFMVAKARNLDLNIGEYSLVRSQNGRLDQLRITLPIKGDYTDIRAFAAGVLSMMPALSLESMTLRREKVSETVLDGRVVFLLFLEPGT